MKGCFGCETAFLFDPLFGFLQMPEETSPVLINTGSNVRGEPLVYSPDDAYRCFMATDMDYLVMENYLFRKEEQPENTDIKKGALDLD